MLEREGNVRLMLEPIRHADRSVADIFPELVHVTFIARRSSSLAPRLSKCNRPPLGRG